MSSRPSRSGCTSTRVAGLDGSRGRVRCERVEGLPTAGVSALAVRGSFRRAVGE
jgi:hypothetical protein